MPDALLSPVVLLGLLLCLAAAACLRGPAPGSAKVASLLALAAYVIVSDPLLANLALGHLEDEATRLQAQCPPPPAGSVLIVLAGGLRTTPRGPQDFDSLSSASLRRLLAAVHIAQHVDPSALWISGGGGSRWREADLMAALAQRLGFPPARIRRDSRSRTTLASGMRLSRWIARSGRGPFYLITSAYHMPRAILSFRLGGRPVCALPVDYQAVHRAWPHMLLPGLDAIHKFALAIHEYLGYAYYALRASAASALSARAATGASAMPGAAHRRDG